MLIRDCMTRQTAGVTMETPVRQIVKLMAEYDVETLPLLDAERHLLGCVTAHDLWAVVSAADDERLDRPIPEAACIAAPSVEADEPLEAAASILFDHPWLEALPVLDEGKIVGILSRHNVIRDWARLSARSRFVQAFDLAEDRGKREACYVAVGVVSALGPRWDENVPDPCIFLG